MNTEFSSILFWYIFILTVGWFSFPLAYTLFRNFPDRGFAVSKTLGLFLITYLIWLTSSVGLTSYQTRSVFMLFILYTILNIVLCILNLKGILAVLHTRFIIFLSIEVIFLAFFLISVLIRMYNPDITGAEKEADFTFLNAILQSDSFPPKDTWFAGGHINYYYFGYAIWATVIKATNIISPVGFNLALATIVALAAVGIFGLVYHFTQKLSYSLFSSMLLMVFGNLDGFVQIVQRQGKLLPFDWWRSSRIIPDTINEFPYFSFLLGDLHAHFMVIPLSLVLLSLLAQFVESAEKSVSKPYVGILVVFIGLLLGGTSVTNGWDYPSYLILAGFCILSIFWTPQRDPNASMTRIVLFGAGIWLALLLLSRALFWPFYQHFSPQLSINNLRIVSFSQRTEIPYFLIIYGLFLWGLFPVIYDRCVSWFSLKKNPSRHELLIWGNSLLLTIALWYLCPSERVFLVAAGISLIFFLLWYRKAISSQKLAFPLLLLFMGFAIIAGCEIVYIQDFYGHPLERQNTIFKFYYQAWVLLSIGTPVAILSVRRRQRQCFSKSARFAWNIGLIGLCGVCCLYPVLATYEKTNHFRGSKHGGLPYIPTLNGISYIAYRHPDEYEALRWIQDHLEKDALILEATGRPYSFFGRVATTTGRSTVLGWGNHESLWRDQSWKSIQKRTEDIKMMYEETDKRKTRDLLEKYQIGYIYVGTLERETYAAEGLEAFRREFPVVYENKQVKIYEYFTDQ